MVAAMSMLLLTSCKEQINHNGKTPLVSVNKEFLYKEDILNLQTFDATLADSTSFAKNYIQHWIEDALLYDVAQHNVPSSIEIEKLVENYRKTLILNMYQRRLVDQQLKREITDAEVERFYRQNEQLFYLDEPVMQGVYLKVSKSAPEIKMVRKWMERGEAADIENLEKYSLTNAIVYDYFQDNWLPLSALAAKMPISSEELLSRIKKEDFVEFSDSAAVFFVNVSSVLDKGEPKPLDLASVEIRELLTNSLRANFIKEVKHNLYNQAVQTGKVKFWTEE